MKRTLRIAGISIAVLSVGTIILGAFILKSNTVEDWGIVGFLASPLIKSLGDK